MKVDNTIKEGHSTQLFPSDKGVLRIFKHFHFCKWPCDNFLGCKLIFKKKNAGFEIEFLSTNFHFQ